MTERDLWPSAESLGFIEELYAEYLRDPAAVDADWRRYFQELPDGDAFAARPALGPSFRRRSVFNPARAAGDNGTAADARALRMADLQDRVDQMVRAYRIRGHLHARIDPLDRLRPAQAELSPDFYGFTEQDLDTVVSTATIEGRETATVREILETLRTTYCRSIGVQFQHIEDLEVKRWLERRMESTLNRLHLSRELQLRVYRWLSDAVIFEKFIQTKYQGAKSFSLEGAESLIPLLELAIEKAGEQGVDEIVIGMAHRGRLNVLANTLKKSAREIFHEFEDADAELYMGRGDVKYHMGYSTDRVTVGGRTVHLSLCFNPSHLEYVNPVVLGRVRAKQDRIGDDDRRRGMALCIHGDAAFAGQGVVQETLNLSGLSGYATGGTLHVIVNNQIGFTTPPEKARSSTYSADVARMLGVPIFHVNGEDPEAVAQVVDVAMDFRDRYQRDVIIDMYCFRRRGHNETDEPAITQPIMYREIRRRKPVRESYLEHLVELGDVSHEEGEAIIAERTAHLEEELSRARSEDYRLERTRHYLDEQLASAGVSAHALDPETWAGIWSRQRGGPEPRDAGPPTHLPIERLRELLLLQTEVPETFHANPKILRRLRQWREMAAGQRALDWAAGEALALAGLACDGYRVRMSGQDVERGTFSHRHGVLFDIEDETPHVPLQHVAANQAPVDLISSPLSEASVLGFEYGYSLDCPDGLVAWEAQFGDFANCAQVIIDQFIASAEDKWRRLSGLVLLLPHGFEGMGPEHSSARLERFLMLSAEDNIQVANPTTPAQYFHLLRRQVMRPWRKPLVIMSPKSLLRHPAATSALADLATGAFSKILPDERAAGAPPASRVLLCSGKVYYDLTRHRTETARDDVAILRLEQLYPLREDELALALAPFAPGTPVIWVQEEPRNMGAWSCLKLRFGDEIARQWPFTEVSRPASASPATGSASSHRMEQQNLVETAVGPGRRS